MFIVRLLDQQAEPKPTGLAPKNAFQDKVMLQQNNEPKFMYDIFHFGILQHLYIWTFGHALWNCY